MAGQCYELKVCVCVCVCGGGGGGVGGGGGDIPVMMISCYNSDGLDEAKFRTNDISFALCCISVHLY